MSKQNHEQQQLQAGQDDHEPHKGQTAQQHREERQTVQQDNDPCQEQAMQQDHGPQLEQTVQQIHDQLHGQSMQQHPEQPPMQQVQQDLELDQDTLRRQAPAVIRQLCRSGAWSGPTAGLAHGHVQANLMILPREAAYDFLLFCQRNPKPCPLIEVVDAGHVTPLCTAGGDLRFDVPGYRIYEHGVLLEEVDDIAAWWRDDLVSFLLGCSFSFESALIDGGVPLRHVQQGLNVAMYKTNIPCQSAGRFAGNMVVSMRPVHASLVPRAVTISARYPQVHGAPLHVGDPAGIGITDLARPDFGDAVEIRQDELPVFWACGVTPQYVAQLARIPFCISHSPGKMLVTDFRTE